MVVLSLALSSGWLVLRMMGLSRRALEQEGPQSALFDSWLQKLGQIEPGASMGWLSLLCGSLWFAFGRCFCWWLLPAGWSVLLLLLMGNNLVEIYPTSLAVTYTALKVSQLSVR